MFFFPEYYFEFLRDITLQLLYMVIASSRAGPHRSTDIRSTDTVSAAFSVAADDHAFHLKLCILFARARIEITDIHLRRTPAKVLLRSKFEFGIQKKFLELVFVTAFFRL